MKNIMNKDDLPTLVVGDLHGQVDLVERAIDSGYPVIFLGDYLDSYSLSVSEQIDTLELILSHINGEIEDSPVVAAMMGNHEMSYLNPTMRCSGYQPATFFHVSNMDLSPLSQYVYHEGFLLSHAGVSTLLLKNKEYESVDQYLEAGDFLQIGYARGGNSPVGGLFWCDWNHEFYPIDGVPQIVGHTRGRGIRQKGNSYCVDCLEDSRTEKLCALIKDGVVVDTYDLFTEL